MTAINEEAERKAFDELGLIIIGSRHAHFDTWCARAQIAAEREAQLEARIAELESRLAGQGVPVSGAVFGGRGIAEGKVSLVDRGDEDQHCAMTGAQRLYLAPPAPSVPDEMPADPFGHPRTYDYATGWNACRAAMFKGGA